MEHAKGLQPHNIAIWDARPLLTTKLSASDVDKMYPPYNPKKITYYILQLNMFSCTNTKILTDLWTEIPRQSLLLCGTVFLHTTYLYQLGLKFSDFSLMSCYFASIV